MLVVVQLWNSFNRKQNKLRLVFRNRHYFKIMDSPELCPPADVEGMTQLNRDNFCKTVAIPVLRVPEKQLNVVLPLIKKILLKMDKLRPVSNDTSEGIEKYKKILLHPSIKDWSSLPAEINKLDLSRDALLWEDIELKYENWKSDELLKAILPKNAEGVSSFSRIGHIIHLNLKEHHEPFKTIIAEILKDKTAGIRTVVNKSHIIDNTYRNFVFDVLTGENDFFVNVRENNVNFEFDFSEVYWNPRLATEHEKLVELLNPGDVLYDVFAGVGPFSIPAAKKKCCVLANDLNPHSYKYLNANARKNKVTNCIKTYNLDGSAFIKTVIKSDLQARWLSRKDNDLFNIHIVMNLPAIAVEFLSAFIGLLDECTSNSIPMPKVHVYCFAKGTDPPETIALELVESNLKIKLGKLLQEVAFVRNVAPNKNMMRVSFYLSNDIVFCTRNKRKTSEDTSELPNSKTLKIHDEQKKL